MKEIRKPKKDSSERIAAPSSSANAQQFDHPIFCLRHIQAGYDIADCTPEQRMQLLEQLRNLSKLTWNEIRSAHRHGLGTEKIPTSIIKPAIPRPPATDDVTFLAFRFAGKAPMVGFRAGAAFRILWLDHNFSVYRHE